MFAPSAWADTVEGKVVEDHSGRPLPSAEVRVLRTGSAGLTADLETDGQGRFQAAEIPSGEYRIEVLKPNYSAATVRLRSGNPAVIVRLVRCGVVSGQVTDQAGQPLRGATVYTMTKPADGGPPRPFANHGPASQVRVDDRGKFLIHSLPPGQYAFAVTYGASSAFASSNGSASPAAGVGSGVLFFPNNTRPRFFTVSGGEDFQDVNFMVTPSPLYSVSGKVELPVEKAQVWVALTNVEQTAFAAAVTRAEPNGNFRFEGIPAGSYHLFTAGPVQGYGMGGAMLGAEPFYGRSRVEIAGLNVEGLSIAVQKGRSVSFALRAAPQSPEVQNGCPPTAQLTLTPIEDWAASIARNTDLSFAKEVALDNLPPARYSIRLGNLGQTCSHCRSGARSDGTGRFETGDRSGRSGRRGSRKADGRSKPGGLRGDARRRRPDRRGAGAADGLPRRRGAFSRSAIFARAVTTSRRRSPLKRRRGGSRISSACWQSMRGVARRRI
jgi:hypothetical protein